VSCPLVAPQGTDLLLAVRISLVIGQHQEWIFVQQAVEKRTEEILVAPCEGARSDEVKHFPQGGIFLGDFLRTVSAELQFPDLFHRQPKQEEVLCADFLADFHAVEGTNGDGAVERKLHVCRCRWPPCRP